MYERFVNIDQNTDEWLSWRRDKIGASDSAVILGLSQWKTRQELWIEKKFGKEKDVKNFYTQRGKDLEKTALSVFEKKTGLHMFPKCITHKTNHWMIASLDGIDLDLSCIVEIKCPGKHDHKSAINGKIPKKYIPQLQHQLEVTGLLKGYYFSFDGSDGVILEFERDNRFIDDMVKEEYEFWRSLQD